MASKSDVDGAKRPTKRRKPIRKRTSARKMKQAVDLYVKEQAMERDGRKCVKCGGTKQLQAAHILPKGRYPNLRFEVANILTLCWRDHFHWQHKDPLGFAQWLDSTYPGRREVLWDMARTAPKADVRELAEALK